MLEEVFWLKASASTADIEAQLNAKKDVDRLKTELSFKVYAAALQSLRAMCLLTRLNNARRTKS